MAFSVAGNYGGVHLSVSGAAVTWTGQSAVTANSGFVVAMVGCDNMSTGELSTNYITGITGGGATWRKIGEWTNANAASLAGAVIAAFIAEPTADMANSALCIANFSPQASRRTVASFRGNKATGASISVTAVQARSYDNQSVGPITISSLTNKEYLFVSGYSGEETAGASFVEMANYTATTRFGGGATSASAMGVRAAWRVLTGTGDTYDPQTILADWAALYFALYEIIPTTISSTIDAALQHALTTTVGLDAALLHELLATGNLDAIIARVGSLSADLGAILQKSLTATGDIDAVLLGQVLKSSSLDAKLQQTIALVVSIDAQLQKTLNQNSSIDAILTSDLPDAPDPDPPTNRGSGAAALLMMTLLMDQAKAKRRV